MPPLYEILNDGIICLYSITFWLINKPKGKHLNDDLYQKYKGSTMPPKTIAGLLLCRIVIICLIGTAAIVAIQIACPHDNNKDTITILLGFLSAAIVGLLSLAKTQENAFMIQEHTEKVSAQLEDLTVTARDAAYKADVAASRAGEAAAKTSQTLSTIQNQTSDK